MGNTIAAVFRAYRLSLSKNFFLCLGWLLCLLSAWSCRRCFNTLSRSGGFACSFLAGFRSPVLVRPAVLAWQLRPAQDKGIQYFHFVGQGHKCRGFKEEIREPDKADRFLRLMNRNRACHIMFCGRLGRRFRERTIDTLYYFSRFRSLEALKIKDFLSPNCP